MRNRFFFLFLIVVFVTPLTNAQTEQFLPQSLSEIIFYRVPGAPGPEGNVTVYLDKEPLLNLQNGTFTRFVTRSGNYIFSTGLGYPSIVRLRAEPGHTYYIKCDVDISRWSVKTVLLLMEPSVGGSEISEKKIIEQPLHPLVPEERKSRLGLIIGGGIGFESIPLFSFQNGDDVTLSTGGGIAIGLQYAYDLTRKINLSIDCFYQGSTLIPTITNGDGTYDRMGITLTPAYIIPIKGGRQYRFIAGAGPGLYCFGSMLVDQSQLGGEKFTFKYSTAIGLHLSLVFQMKFTEKSAMSIGVKYYNVQYNYKEDGSTNTIVYPEFINPDGSGIDFTIGYFFNF